MTKPDDIARAMLALKRAQLKPAPKPPKEKTTLTVFLEQLEREISNGEVIKPEPTRDE